MARFKTNFEVSNDTKNEWRLCFQYGTYYYDDGDFNKGFRFIWRKPNGNLQPARGQARIPNEKELFYLIEKAAKEGWFNNEREELT